MNRDFKGVWIPRDVWVDRELGWVEKLFFVEIDSLDNEDGCYASNNYFANFFNITPQRASQIINSLVEKGKISRQLIMEGDRVKKRILRVAPKYKGGYQENLPGYQGKVEDNNTENNKTDLEEKKSKAEVRDLFFSRYRMKAREITGRDTNDDGKPIRPTWAGKEGKLFNLDLETHGIKTIRNYIELFFSDKVPEVAKFCRFEEKAGYGYSVFHGMIGKLALSKVKLEICPICGKDKGHHTWCSTYDEIQAKKLQEVEEILAEQETVTDTDLVADMMNSMRRNKDVNSKSEQF